MSDNSMVFNMDFRLFKELAIKISYWLWFGLILALIPLIISVWQFLETNEFTKACILSSKEGELLLVNIAGIGTTLGELIKEDYNDALLKVWIGGFGVMLFCFATWAYNSVKFGDLNEVYIFNTSLSVSVGMGLVALATIVLPKRKDTGV